MQLNDRARRLLKTMRAGWMTYTGRPGHAVFPQWIQPQHGNIALGWEVDPATDDDANNLPVQYRRYHGPTTSSEAYGAYVEGLYGIAKNAGQPMAAQLYGDDYPLEGPRLLYHGIDT